MANTIETTVASAEAPNVLPDSQTRLRLGYLDGLRGLAALYVVVHHAAFSHFDPSTFPHWLRIVTKPFAYAHFAVGMFIVLSGYCLMLPVTRSVDGSLKGGFAEFVRRRGRRILPPYYAALVLSIVLNLLSLSWSRSGGSPLGNPPVPIASPEVLSHLFLVHNLNPNWIKSIDIPMWSVATEWQIYFVFALLLLPIWRRLGIWSTVAIAFILGLAPHFLMHNPETLDGARFWYLGLFAFGMAGAEINFSTHPVMKTLRSKTPWFSLTAVLAVALMGASMAKSGYWTAHPWLVDPWAGLAGACLLIGMTQALSTGRQPALLRLLETTPVRKLGEFSYSLYLIHYPILQLVAVLLASVCHSLTSSLIAGVVIGVPVAVACAYLFSLAFEKPFTRRS